ncbi:MAG: hypothetical protein ACRD43_13260 [Pyrinomonadaceae bacterium]
MFLAVSASADLGQTPDTKLVASVNIENLYVAKDDGTGKAGDAVNSFSTTDIPIYCVVMLDSATPVTVKMNFVAEKVPGVKAETKVVSVSYTTKDGQNRVNFTGKPAGNWVAGTYRADIFLDGKLAKNISFEIKGGPAKVESATLFQPKTTPKSKVRPVRKKN